MAKRIKRAKNNDSGNDGETRLAHPDSADSTIAEANNAPTPSATETTQSAEFQVDEVKTVSDERRQRRLESAARWRAKKRMAENMAGSTESPDMFTVAAFLAIVDSLAQSFVGPSGAMLPHERELIEKPALRMLARMDESTREAVNTWADPIALTSGLLMWLSRVYAIRQDAQETKEVTRTPQPVAEVEIPATQAPLFEFVAPPPREETAADAVADAKIFERVNSVTGVILQ